MFKKIRAVQTHIRATTGVPRKPYEGLHVTKKHTHVMDINCMPSRVGCNLKVEGVRYIEMHRGLHMCLVRARLLQRAEISN